MNSAILYHKRHLAAITVMTFLVVSLHLSALFMRPVNAQTTYEVKISGFAFVPQNRTISSGDTIVWNNTDPVIHTLWFVFVANGSTYLLSDPIPPDSTWAHTFNDIVELQYYSFDMLWITGFINVTAAVPGHDVAVTEVTTCKDGGTPKPIVTQNRTAHIYAKVLNEGIFAETFNVTAFANATPIGEQQVTLNPGQNTTLTFVWDSTGFPKGNYTISATADTVPGEADIADNTYTDGWILVTKPGDVTGDDSVNVLDLIIVANALWVYNPTADLNDDHTINVLDLILVANNLGT